MTDIDRPNKEERIMKKEKGIRKKEQGTRNKEQGKRKKDKGIRKKELTLCSYVKGHVIYSIFGFFNYL